MTDPVGIDADNLTGWFTEHLQDVVAPLDFHLIAGGRSNLTYKVTDHAGHAWVLRRPPTGDVLPTAHDIAREHRIIAALAPTPVPVARALGLCSDIEVTGAPFYVMAYLEGHVLRDARMAESTFTPDLCRRAGEAVIDVLADLHAIDVEVVGLADLGRHDGYIARQLTRWYDQFGASCSETGRSVPLVDEVHDRLAGTVPDQQGVALVHGDYRVDNTMFADDARVLGVLDWEICTLGDPLADVGLLMVHWSEASDTNLPLGVSPTSAPGFPTRLELLERYGARTGRDLSGIGYYTAFGYWKLACILEGVYAADFANAEVGERGAGVGGDFSALADQVGVLAQAAADALG